MLYELVVDRKFKLIEDQKNKTNILNNQIRFFLDTSMKSKLIKVNRYAAETKNNIYFWSDDLLNYIVHCTIFIK